MRIAKLLWVAIFLAIFSFAAAAQSVVITKRTVKYTRPKPQTKHKRTFLINYPKVKAVTPVVSAKIENQLSYFKNFEFTLEEEKTDLQWLTEADYQVQHNANGILSVALTINGYAAYPDSSNKHIVVDIRNGNQLTAANLFTNTGGLASFADKRLQAEIAAAKKRIKTIKAAANIDVNDLFEGKVFDVESLNDFSVTKDGVTFYYDYGFPHAIEALQPNGDIKFTWAELKPHINPTGLLATFVR